MKDKIQVSSYAISEAWYPIAMSNELKDKPISRKILGQNIAIFRVGGKCHAVLDECPHRKVQLSLGSIDADGIRCGYHGWKFSGKGECLDVPTGDQKCVGRLRIPFFSVIESQSLIWIYATANVVPNSQPHFIEYYNDKRFKLFQIKPFLIKASIANCLENFVDVSHTRFLHTGFGRVGKMNDIQTSVKTEKDRISVEYLNEPQPKGLIFKLLTPKSERMKHIDRVILPGIVQSEYHFSSKYSSLVQDYLTPVDENLTLVFSFTTFKMPIPRWIVQFIGRILSGKILKQDKEILENQSIVLQSSQRKNFVSAESDVFWKFIYNSLINKSEIEETNRTLNYKI